MTGGLNKIRLQTISFGDPFDGHADMAAKRDQPGESSPSLYSFSVIPARERILCPGVWGTAMHSISIALALVNHSVVSSLQVVEAYRTCF